MDPKKSKQIQQTYQYSGYSKKDIDGKNATEHRTILRFVKFLDVLAVGVPFIIAWMFYYSEKMVVPYFRLGNFFVIFFYYIIFYLLAHLYEGFTIHISSISEIIYAQVLAAVITNALIYIIMGFLLYHVPNVLYILLVLAVQVGIIVSWAVISHRWYFRHYPSKQVVIIYDEVKNLEKLVSEYGLKAHFHVIANIDVHDVFTKDNDPETEKDGVARLSTGKNNSRITKIGRFIRSCRMNELPQLINILKDDMSIVGPRTGKTGDHSAYKEKLLEFDLRLNCRCGLIGYTQVYGTTLRLMTNCCWI